MSRNIEIEFKNILTINEFALLLKTFNILNEQFFTQTNHYFDTEDFLLKQMSSALRIRELDDHFELTLKKPEKIGLLEINQQLTHLEAKSLMTGTALPKGEVHDELQQMMENTGNLSYFGSLTTKRAEIEYQNGLLVFDHSFYLGNEDFEIEYEVDDWEAGRKTFSDLLMELNIEIKKTDNKINRFYQAKKLKPY